MQRQSCLGVNLHYIRAALSRDRSPANTCQSINFGIRVSSTLPGTSRTVYSPFVELFKEPRNQRRLEQRDTPWKKGRDAIIETPCVGGFAASSIRKCACGQDSTRSGLREEGGSSSGWKTRQCNEIFLENLSLPTPREWKMEVVVMQGCLAAANKKLAGRLGLEIGGGHYA